MKHCVLVTLMIVGIATLGKASPIPLVDTTVGDPLPPHIEDTGGSTGSGASGDASNVNDNQAGGTKPDGEDLDLPLERRTHPFTRMTAGVAHLGQESSRAASGSDGLDGLDLSNYLIRVRRSDFVTEMLSRGLEHHPTMDPAKVHQLREILPPRGVHLAGQRYSNEWVVSEVEKNRPNFDASQFLNFDEVQRLRMMIHNFDARVRRGNVVHGLLQNQPEVHALPNIPKSGATQPYARPLRLPFPLQAPAAPVPHVGPSMVQNFHQGRPAGSRAAIERRPLALPTPSYDVSQAGTSSLHRSDHPSLNADSSQRKSSRDSLTDEAPSKKIRLFGVDVDVGRSS